MTLTVSELESYLEITRKIALTLRKESKKSSRVNVKAVLIKQHSLTDSEANAIITEFIKRN
jgi:hypothetical protein